MHVSFLGFPLLDFLPPSFSFILADSLFWEAEKRWKVYVSMHIHQVLIDESNYTSTCKYWSAMMVNNDHFRVDIDTLTALPSPRYNKNEETVMFESKAKFVMCLWKHRLWHTNAFSDIPFLVFLRLWSTKSHRLLPKMAPCDTIVVARHFYPVCYKADSSGSLIHKCITVNHRIPCHPVRLWRMTAWHHHFPLQEHSLQWSQKVRLIQPA